ncbi:MAG: hypothetical protein KatS3mg113_0910 [Planctomycetaceae bacterium]|nr:MAG: hypothetical protein KatS3mg113_0910 [Planctomycetaceae bacterium]
MISNVRWINFWHRFQQSMQLFRLGREYPPVNLYARPHEFLLTTEIPGVKPEDLEITVNQGVLTIRGQRLGPRRDSG